MRKVFADSGYWVALLNPRDALHTVAITVSARLRDTSLVTSEMVLTEVLNHFSDAGGTLRAAVADFVERLCNDGSCVVVPQTSLLFRRALELYQQRSDKSWSVTDCASILIMQDAKITEALTHDRHFQQAGLIALLQEGN